MIELDQVEIDAVSGGASAFTLVITVLNYALEFLTGFVDGVNDATGG